jgi:hypothetical protein
LIPALSPQVHPDLPTPTALASAYQDRAARCIEVGLSKTERFADPQSRPPQDHD